MITKRGPCIQPCGTRGPGWVSFQGFLGREERRAGGPASAGQHGSAEAGQQLLQPITRATTTRASSTKLMQLWHSWPSSRCTKSKSLCILQICTGGPRSGGLRSICTQAAHLPPAPHGPKHQAHLGAPGRHPEPGRRRRCCSASVSAPTAERPGAVTAGDYVPHPCHARSLCTTTATPPRSNTPLLHTFNGYGVQLGIKSPLWGGSPGVDISRCARGRRRRCRCRAARRGRHAARR